MALRRVGYALACPLLALAEHNATISCSTTENGLKVAWTALPSIEQYDLQIGVPGEESIIGGHHLDAPVTSLLMDRLVPEQTYWFQLRATMQLSNGTGDWILVSNRTTCFASKPAVVRATSVKAQQHKDYFSIETVRLHTPPGDGLINRNSANARGEQWLLDTPWKFGMGCDLTMYKVHVKRVDIPNQVTPQGEGGGHYANYMSCNKVPLLGYQCTRIALPDCSILGVTMHCLAAENDKYSNDHVGMGVVAHTGNEARWYSTPKSGLTKGNWFRDTQYRTAKCHRGMSAAAIKAALHMNMQKYFLPWDADISAFEESTENNQLPADGMQESPEPRTQEILV